MLPFTIESSENKLTIDKINRAIRYLFDNHDGFGCYISTDWIIVKPYKEPIKIMFPLKEVNHAKRRKNPK